MLAPVVSFAALALSGTPSLSIDDETTRETNVDTIGTLEVRLSRPNAATIERARGTRAVRYVSARSCGPGRSSTCVSRRPTSR
jgi:hypothetical protein